MTICTIDPAELYVARLGTDHSRRTARAALATLARLLGVEDIDWGATTYAEWSAVRAGLTNYSVSWGNICLSILRSVIREGQRLNLVDSALMEAVHSLPRLRGHSGRLGRDIDGGEIATLLNVVDHSTLAGRRDGALLALLVAGGLRRSECASVDVGEWSPRTRRLLIRDAKGRSPREIPFPAWAGELLDDLLAMHPGDGRLLRSVDSHGRLGQSLSPRSVHAIIDRLCRKAEIEVISPHAFRAHRITEIIDAGDPLLAQRLAGHADLSTTSRYDRRSTDQLAQVVDGLDGPGKVRRLRAVS